MPYPFPPTMMGGLLPFAVAASPSSAGVSQPYNGSPEVTNSVTVSQTSGLAGSLNFAWSHVSGDASINVTSPAAATTTFSATPPQNTTTSAVKRCTVTNSLGQQAIVNVPVTITATPPPPPPFKVTCSPGTYSDLSIPAGQPVSIGVSASAANGDGNYSFVWSIFGPGSIGPTTGPGTTFNISGQAAGTTLDTTLACDGSDTSGHADRGNCTIHLHWN